MCTVPDFLDYWDDGVQGVGGDTIDREHKVWAQGAEGDDLKGYGNR